MIRRTILLALTFGLTAYFFSGYSTPANNTFNNEVNDFKSSVHQDTADTIFVDHHAHIFSEPVRNYLEENVEGVSDLPPLGMEQLAQTMQRDRVDKAVILSNGYLFSDPARNLSKGFEKLQQENDRIARVVSENPEKAVGFFSVNPLSDSTSVEIERNASRTQFAGLKLHLANSGIDLRNEDHVEQLAGIFEQANKHELGIIIHLRTQDEKYGRKDAEVFIQEILSEAPDIPVQIAHLAGWGGYDPATDEALGVFADRIEEGELGDNVFFDVSAVVRSVSSDAKSGSEENSWYPEERYDRLTQQLRSIGVDRLLFGTDWPEWQPSQYKSDLEAELPLEEQEFKTIFNNRAPWIAS